MLSGNLMSILRDIQFYHIIMIIIFNNINIIMKTMIIIINVNILNYYT